MLLLAATISACGTPGNTNIRSKEQVQCKTGEQKVCRGATPTRLESGEQDSSEFCRCEPRDTQIDRM